MNVKHGRAPFERAPPTISASAPGQTAGRFSLPCARIPPCGIMRCEQMSERTNVGKRGQARHCELRDMLQYIIDRIDGYRDHPDLPGSPFTYLPANAPDAGTVTYEPTGDPDIWLKPVTTEVPPIERALSEKNRAFKELIERARASRERSERADDQAKRRQAAMQIERSD